MYPEGSVDGVQLSGHDNTFPKREKLKHRKSIQYLFEKGSSFSAFPIRLIYFVQPAIPQEDIAKFSVSVSKRNFSSAVDRNQIKRKVREAYRLNKRILLSYCSEKKVALHMMWIYTAKEKTEYKRIESQVTLLIRRLIDRIS